MARAPDDPREAALRALVREAIAAAGTDDPAALPHRVRDRLAARVDGATDLDAAIAETLRELGLAGDDGTTR